MEKNSLQSIIQQLTNAANEPSLTFLATQILDRLNHSLRAISPEFSTMSVDQITKKMNEIQESAEHLRMLAQSDEGWTIFFVSFTDGKGAYHSFEKLIRADLYEKREAEKEFFMKNDCHGVFKNHLIRPSERGLQGALHKQKMMHLGLFAKVNYCPHERAVSSIDFLENTGRTVTYSEIEIHELLGDSDSKALYNDINQTILVNQAALDLFEKAVCVEIHFDQYHNTTIAYQDDRFKFTCPIRPEEIESSKAYGLIGGQKCHEKVCLTTQP